MQATAPKLEMNTHERIDTLEQKVSSVVARLDTIIESVVSSCFTKQTAVLLQRQEEMAAMAAKAVVLEVSWHAGHSVAPAGANLVSSVAINSSSQSAQVKSSLNGSMPPGPATLGFPPNVYRQTTHGSGTQSNNHSDVPPNRPSGGPAARTEELRRRLATGTLPSLAAPNATVKEQAKDYVRKQLVDHGGHKGVMERVMNASMEDRAGVCAARSISGRRTSAKRPSIGSIGSQIGEALAASQRGRLQRLVENPVFDWACALVIVVHAFIVGVMVDVDAEDMSPLGVINHAFQLFFVIELCMRLVVYKLEYFKGERWNWNVFDVCLVVQYLIDTTILIFFSDADGSTPTSWKGFRILRLLRVVRIIRVLRFCKELGFMALSIMDSLKSLLWAIILLAIIMYVFAVAFTQSTTEHFKTLSQEGKASTATGILEERFATLPKAFYTLMLSVTNGMNWGEVCNSLMEIDAFMPALFLFYIAFTILALLNIITGIFVDSAVQTTKMQSEFVVQKELELREKYVADMQDMFAEMDVDGSGTISFEEFKEFFSVPEIRTYFWALGLNGRDGRRLFKLLDVDNSGEVSINEFLDGCLRLKGEARSIDVHQLLVEVKKQAFRLSALHREVRDVYSLTSPVVRDVAGKQVGSYGASSACNSIGGNDENALEEQIRRRSFNTEPSQVRQVSQVMSHVPTTLESNTSNIPDTTHTEVCAGSERLRMPL